MKKYYLSEMTKDFSMIGAQRGESAVNSQSELAARSVAAKIAARPRSQIFLPVLDAKSIAHQEAYAIRGDPKIIIIAKGMLDIYMLFLRKCQAS